MLKKERVKLVTKSVRITCPQAKVLETLSQMTGLNESDIIRSLMKEANVEDTVKFIQKTQAA